MAPCAVETITGALETITVEIENQIYIDEVEEVDEESLLLCSTGLCYCEMLHELNLMILMIDSTSGERCYLEATLGFMLFDSDEMELVQVVDDHEKVDRLVSEKIMSRKDDQFLSVKLTHMSDEGFDFCCVFENFDRQRLTRKHRGINLQVLIAIFKVFADKLEAKKDKIKEKEDQEEEEEEEEEGAGNNALEVNEEDLAKALQIKHQIELTFLNADAQAMTESDDENPEETEPER